MELLSGYSDAGINAFNANQNMIGNNLMNSISNQQALQQQQMAMWNAQAAWSPTPYGYGFVPIYQEFSPIQAPGTYSPGSGLSSFSGVPLSGGGGGDVWSQGAPAYNTYGGGANPGGFSPSPNYPGGYGAELYNAPRQYGWDANEGAPAPAAPQVYNKGEFNPQTYGWDHNEGAAVPPTPSFDDIWNGRGAASLYQNNEWFNQPVWQNQMNQNQASPMDFLDRYQWPTDGGYDVGGQSRSYANPMNRVDWASSFGDNSPALKDTLRQWGAESGGRYDPELDRLSGSAWSYLNDPNNLDLRNAFGTDIGAAAQHAQQYGKNEGRNLYGLPGSTGATEYMNANRDVFDAFGGDPLKAAQHWQNYGQFENRDPQGLSKSSAALYLEANPDVAQKFGNDPQKAEQHWQGFGQFEGRGGFGMQKSPAAQYLEANPDVAQAFGNDPAKALQHYQQAGQFEGREGFGIQRRYDIAKALVAQMPSGQIGGENTNTYGAAPATNTLSVPHGSIYQDPFGGYVPSTAPNSLGPGMSGQVPGYTAYPGFDPNPNVRYDYSNMGGA